MKKLKKLIIILIILLLVVGAVYGGFLLKSKDKLSNREVKDINRTIPEKDFIMNKLLLREVIEHAKKGTVPNVSVIVGETKYDDVITEFGEPNNSTAFGDGIYIDYESENLSFGYKGETIFDVRSLDEELSNISYKEILHFSGQPDEERYYKDEQLDQIILVYQLNKNYQLKWVLPRPTEEEPNPKLHHIVVFTEPANLVEDSSLLETLTLDEKIGQMIIAGIEGTTPTPETINLIEDYKVGGIIFFRDNLTSYSQARNLVNGIKRMNANSNNIPLFLSVDQEGGRVFRLPDLEGLPTSWDIGINNNPELSYQVGNILAQQLHAYGMNMNYAPVLDVNNNPDNPVIGDRAFGDSPDLVTKLGIQTMKGMSEENIIPVIKHFPGHGDTTVDSHYELPLIDKSLQQLYDLELIPFIEAIGQGADVVMIAHILFPQLDSVHPSSMSKAVITELLREELGFDGVVVTDDMMMDAIENHYDIGDAAVLSIKSGTDIILISEHYEDIVHTIEKIKMAVQQGELSEQRIDESVERILRLKEKYNLNNEEVEYHDLQYINEQINTLF
ncbi:beta-N-acetylhexosaminidase [Ornithinibacillus halotolerans]|uniref:beta-N-acetylhexosaminidase n=1 Tax=Ornithinibacillus halotolerans TaxID=1274357 RepID=UPI0016649281|nr:beta-N-acetylhexosaminidase [Ornithinibacillus halotolerans]